MVDLDGVDARINDWYLPDGAGDVVGAFSTGRGVYGDDEVMVTTPPAGLPVALADTVSGLASSIVDTYAPNKGYIDADDSAGVAAAIWHVTDGFELGGSAFHPTVPANGNSAGAIATYDLIMADLANGVPVTA